MRATASFLLSVVLTLAAPFSAIADPGQLDPAFGSGGIARFDFAHQYPVTINATARQADGKIVLAGGKADTYNRVALAIGRLNADGSPDTGFGNNGWVVVRGVTLNNNENESAQLVAVQPDGKIVAYLQDSTYSYLLRLNPDGSRDYYFGYWWNGVAVSSGTWGETARAMAALPDGSFVVAGSTTWQFSMQKDAQVTIYSSNGARGSSTVVAFSEQEDEFTSVHVRPDGSYFAAGYASGTTRDFAVAKFGPWLGLDQSFGPGGKITVNMGGYAEATAVAVDAWGGLLVGGWTMDLNTGEKLLALARAAADTGLPDTAFGNQGQVAVSLPSPYSPYVSATVASIESSAASNTIYAMGSLQDYVPNVDFAIAAFTSSGALQTTFGSNGIVVGPSTPEADAALGAYLSDDGTTLTIAGSRGTFGVPATAFVAAQYSASTGQVGSVSTGNAYAQSDDIADAFALQPDGRMVLAGTMDTQPTAWRLNADGTLDATFGTAGRAAFGLSGFTYEPVAAALQPDGKILIASTVTSGANNNRWAVTRLNADGSTDYSYGFQGDGYQSGIWGWVTSMALQPDGKALVAGYYWTSSGGSARTRFAVLRLTQGGSPDYTFGNTGAGIAVLDRGGTADDNPGAIAVQPDGKILIAGSGVVSGNPSKGLVIRLNANGSVDSTWGNAGEVTAFTSGYAIFRALAVQPDSRVLGFAACNGPGATACLARWNSAGQPDASFGTAGEKSLPIGMNVNSASALALQPDGKILGGTSSYLFRLESDGTLDGNFAGGVAYVPLSFFFASMGLRDDGTTLVGGTAMPNLAYDPNDIAVAAFQGGGPDQMPDAFSFTDVSNVAVSATITSAPVTITGINVATSVNVSGGTYSIGCTGSFVSATGSINNGETVCVRHTSAAASNTATNTTLTVGGVSDVFTSTTGALPDTSITSSPPNPSNSQSASFGFTAPGAVDGFECKLDGAAFGACSSPASYSSLADGSHTFQVRSYNSIGADPTPASFTWTVDATPPDTLLAFQPAVSPSNSNSYTATFSSEFGATFECRLDGAAYAPCTSPKTQSGLADGSHTFDVRAKDAAGNVDPTPATRTWTIDTVPPDTTIVSGPSGTVASTDAVFTHSSSESPSMFFECRLDGAAFSACGPGISYSNLAQGSHTFEVRAKDSAGNLDPTPASRTWTVDTVAPDTSITSGPTGTVASTSASLTFTATEGGSTFECRLDGAAFAACTSPVSLSGLGQGGHTFDVRARDAAGNIDATPASRSWTVDTQPPETTIDNGPSGSVASTTASFTYHSNEVGTTFACKLDAGAYVDCSASGPTYTGLSQGSHTFQVRATDSVGNVDPTPATRTWTVDTVAPDTTITGGPSGTNNGSTATFTFTSNESGTFQCKLDTGAFAACASGVTYNNLPRGDHTFQVRAIDLAGNVDPTPATRTWRSK